MYKIVSFLRYSVNSFHISKMRNMLNNLISVKITFCKRAKIRAKYNFDIKPYVSNTPYVNSDMAIIEMADENLFLAMMNIQKHRELISLFFPKIVLDDNYRKVLILNDRILNKIKKLSSYNITDSNLACKFLIHQTFFSLKYQIFIIIHNIINFLVIYRNDN